MDLTKIPFLIDKANNDVFFRLGDIVSVSTMNTTYSGKLIQFKDVELTLDTSEQYNSSFTTLIFSEIVSITKI